MVQLSSPVPDVLITSGEFPSALTAHPCPGPWPPRVCLLSAPLLTVAFQVSAVLRLVAFCVWPPALSIAFSAVTRAGACRSPRRCSAPSCGGRAAPRPGDACARPRPSWMLLWSLWMRFVCCAVLFLGCLGMGSPSVWKLDLFEEQPRHFLPLRRRLRSPVSHVLTDACFLIV